MLIINLNNDVNFISISEWKVKRDRAIDLAMRLGRNVIVRLQMKNGTLEYTHKENELRWEVIPK